MSSVCRQVWNIAIGITDDMTLIIANQLTCYSGFPYFKYHVSKMPNVALFMCAKSYQEVEANLILLNGMVGSMFRTKHLEIFSVIV
jgi:hypothetical protein